MQPDHVDKDRRNRSFGDTFYVNLYVEAGMPYKSICIGAYDNRGAMYSAASKTDHSAAWT